MQQKIVVLGAGESGVGAAFLAQQKGFEVFVSDRGKIKDNFKKELEEKGIPYEEGQHTIEKIFTATEIIKSPGIPDRVPMIVELQEKGIPVISEIEFASRYTDAFLIGITGSNGKTTTAMLTYHLLQAANLDVVLAGNVGDSFARKVAEKEVKYYVLELSSFQLDGIDQFRPHISLLLNITPDHLDRYDYKMENYIRSKFRITRNQTATDNFYFKKEDENISGYMAEHNILPQKEAISSTQIDKEKIKLADASFDLSTTRLRGQHNAMNALFAVSIAKQLYMSDEQIQVGLNTFVNVAHRMEVVAEIDGVEYINDSKATNVDATFYALEAMKRPVVWIVGGQDKGNDYKPLENLVSNKVKSIVFLGVDNTNLIDLYGQQKKWVEAKSAEEAVQIAKRMAEQGDVILLSPACASFDLFKNYENRGDLFREAVLQLKDK